MSADNNPMRRNWSWPFGKPEETKWLPSTVEDKRDLRDAEKLGLRILILRKRLPDLKPSEIYDELICDSGARYRG